MAEDNARGLHARTIHFQRDGGHSQRPVEGSFLPNLVMRDFPPVGCRDDHLGDDLVGQEVVLAIAVRLRDDVELLERKLALAFGTFEANFGAVGDQYRHNRRWADEPGRTIIAENRMIAVIALFHEFLARLVFRKKAKAVAEIPAAGALAEISAHRGHVANLRAGGFVHSFGKCRIFFSNARVLRDFCQGRE